MRYIGILLEFSENMRYIGIPDPQNEVYWYGIEIRSKSEISNNEVYWYIWPNFGKVRYFGMKPILLVVPGTAVLASYRGNRSKYTQM